MSSVILSNQKEENQPFITEKSRGTCIWTSANKRKDVVYLWWLKWKEIKKSKHARRQGNCLTCSTATEGIFLTISVLERYFLFWAIPTTCTLRRVRFPSISTLYYGQWRALFSQVGFAPDIAILGLFERGSRRAINLFRFWSSEDLTSFRKAQCRVINKRLSSHNPISGDQQAHWFASGHRSVEALLERTFRSSLRASTKRTKL